MNSRQESFLRIFRSYSSYHPEKPLKPWIYKIVVNTTRTVLKQQARNMTVPLCFDVPSEEMELGQRLLDAEFRTTLIAALEHLSRKSKEIIVLRFFQNMSLTDISVVLSIPLGTCKSRLNTAMNQLRKTLPSSIVRQDQGGDTREES